MKYFIYDPNFDPEAAAEPPTPEMMMEMGQFIEDVRQSGALVATGALTPQGKRLRLADGKFTVTDGPFVELKELMAGFAILQADTLEEVIELSKRFRKIIGDGESEIVPLFDPSDFAEH